MANLTPRRGQANRGELAPRRQDTFSPFHDVFDTFFNRLMSQWGGPLTPEFSQMRLWDLNVDQTDQEVIVRADLPGFEPDEIDIHVDDNFLTIQAEKHQKGEHEQEFRSYSRMISLPAGVDSSNVTASYRNGVVELHLARREEAKPKRIRVQGDGTSGQQAKKAESSGAMPAKPGEKKS